MTMQSHRSVYEAGPLADLLQYWKRSELSAVRLRDCWGVRPQGCLGTCGWREGNPWQIVYVRRLPEGVRDEG